MRNITKLFLGGILMLSMSSINAAETAKSIVIYFSRTGENYSVGVIKEGNTAKVAKVVAAMTGSDIFEVKEADKYPVNYNECIARAKKEVQTKARPAFLGTAPDLSKYDTIYLGYPNWWGDVPMVVYTLLEKAKVDSKTILPFCTHEGSGLGSCVKDVKKAYPKANVLQGFSMYGHDVRTGKERVEKWLKKLGYQGK